MLHSEFYHHPGPLPSSAKASYHRTVSLNRSPPPAAMGPLEPSEGWNPHFVCISESPSSSLVYPSTPSPLLFSSGDPSLGVNPGCCFNALPWVFAHSLYFIHFCCNLHNFAPSSISAFEAVCWPPLVGKQHASFSAS